MRRISAILAIFAVVGLIGVPAVAAPMNLALNGNVYYFTSSTLGQGGWGSGILAPPSTVVDGIFLPEGTQWDQNTIWWDENSHPLSPYFFEISIYFKNPGWVKSLKIQADNNDEYFITARLYGLLVGNYTIPTAAGWGMETREIIFPTPLEMNRIDFVRNVWSDVGDGYYSVSEIQAWGDLAPLPGTVLLLVSGLLGLVGLRRFS